MSARLVAMAGVFGVALAGGCGSRIALGEFESDSGIMDGGTRSDADRAPASCAGLECGTRCAAGYCDKVGNCSAATPVCTTPPAKPCDGRICGDRCEKKGETFSYCTTAGDCLAKEPVCEFDKEGGQCGGLGGFTCSTGKAGLKCVLEGSFPDAPGACRTGSRVFACGASECYGRNEYCELLSGGIASADGAVATTGTCKALPAGCALDVTCACVLPGPANGSNQCKVSSENVVVEVFGI